MIGVHAASSPTPNSTPIPSLVRGPHPVQPAPDGGSDGPLLCYGFPHEGRGPALLCVRLFDCTTCVSKLVARCCRLPLASRVSRR